MPSPLPPASEILARVRQVYRECASYEDTTESTACTRVAGQPSSHTTIVRSSTAFERPDRLRFESMRVGVGPEEEWTRAAGWGRDGKARSWWSLQPEVVEREGLFDAATHSTTAPPAALSILALLLPDAKPHDPLAEDGRVVGIEPVDGTPCFALEVKDVRGRTMRVHVDRDTYLVRRMEQTMVIDATAHEEIQRRTRASLESGEIPENARQAMEEMLARGPSAMPDQETLRVTVFHPALDPRIEPERFSFVPPSTPAADLSHAPGHPVALRAAPSSVSAAEVLARVREAYRSCSTYADVGEVTTAHRGSARVPRHTQVLRFSTAFDRSGRFRFEYKEVDVGPEAEWTHYVIWDDGSGCRSWWTVRPEVAHHEKLHDPIGAATGVSAVSAYRVPTLLVPGGKGRDPLPDDATLAGTDRVDAAECYVLDVQSHKGGTRRIWIDASSFLLRRVEERYSIGAEARAGNARATQEMLDQGKVPERLRAPLQEFLRRDLNALPDLGVTSLTSYRPIVDAEVAPERFAFTPPFVGPAPWER